MRGVTVELKTSILLSGFAVTSIPWYPVTVVMIYDGKSNPFISFRKILSGEVEY